MSVRRNSKKVNLPATFQQFTKRFPDLAAVHEAIAQSVDQMSPRDRKTIAISDGGV